MKVACFSVAALDFFPQHNQYFAGGNSLNQAICFQQLGHQSAFLGALGTDEAGDRIADLLQRKSIDASHMHRINGTTATNQLIDDESGERFGLDGAWNGGVYETFKLTESDWEYVSEFDVWATHGNSPVYSDALERKAHQFMSVDFLHLLDPDLLQKSLGIIDIAFIGGTLDMVDEMTCIAKQNKGLLVLTLGAKGSMAFQGDKVYTQKALPIDKVIDTTGCGDAFQAAFTAKYFETKDIQASLLAGAESGRKAAMTLGGIPWE